MRLQLHALAYNLANFLRTLALPGEVERWSLTSLREKVVKIGAKVIAHGRYAIFQMCRGSCSAASSTESRGCDHHPWRDVDPRRTSRRSRSRADVRPPPVRRLPVGGRRGRGVLRRPLRRELGHDGPELACRARPTRATP